MAQVMAPEAMPESTATPTVDAVDLEALKGGIMAEIEAKLSKKEDHLWKRGQVEIKRLQQDQQQVKDTISQIHERQSALLADNKQIRGALLEVTSRFELVVKEMREVLRALPQQRGDSANGSRARAALQPSPSPSVASTAASEALDQCSPDTSYDLTMTGSTEKTGNRTSNASTTVPRIEESPGANSKDPRRDVEEMTGATFCTPPRNDSALAQDSSLDAGTAGSPAVLSLAKSLPPASTSTPNSSPGACKRLQLAECLDGGLLPSTASLPAPPSPPALRQMEPTSSTVAGTVPSAARQFDFVTVEIVKESGFVTLGIEVNQVDGVSLCVESIDEHGLVGRHNAKQDAHSASRVQVGDRVIEVNNIRQDPNSMLQECKVRQRLSFTIARDSCRRKASDSTDGSLEGDTSAATPATRRLRPEASVFVPASQVAQEAQCAPPLVLPAVAVVPPGFESFDTSGLLTLPTGPSLGTQFASMLEAAAGGGLHCPPPALPPPPPFSMPGVNGSFGYDDEEEVKRALVFP